MDQIPFNDDKQRGVIYNSKKPVGGIYYYDAKEKPVKVDKETGQTTVSIKTKSPEPKKIIETKTEIQEPEFKRVEEGFDNPNNTNIKAQEIKHQIRREEIAQRVQELRARIHEYKEQKMLAEIEGQEINFHKPKIVRTKVVQRVENAEAIVKDLKDSTNPETIAEKFEKEMKIVEEQENGIFYSKNYIVSIKDKKVDFTKEGIARPQLTRKEKQWLAKAQNYFITAEEKGRKIGSAEEFTTMEILEALWATANHVGVDPKRFIVQIYNESRFNPYVKGKAGERGIGQFTPSTAKYHRFNWAKMKDGIDGFAYQAKAAAEFVKIKGEVAYNGKNKKGERYKDLISSRVNKIHNNSSSCVMKDQSTCQS